MCELILAELDHFAAIPILLESLRGFSGLLDHVKGVTTLPGFGGSLAGSFSYLDPQKLRFES